MPKFPTQAPSSQFGHNLRLHENWVFWGKECPKSGQKLPQNIVGAKIFEKSPDPDFSHESAAKLQSGQNNTQSGHKKGNDFEKLPHRKML